MPRITQFRMESAVRMYLFLVFAMSMTATVQADVYDLYGDLQPVNRVFNGGNPNCGIYSEPECSCMDCVPCGSYATCDPCGPCGSCFDWDSCGPCEDCDLCGDCEECDSCWPAWTVRMSAVFLTRKDPGALNLYTGPGGQTLLNADQFNFNYRAGLDTSVIYQFDQRTGIQGRYLWVDRFEDSSPLFNLPAGTSHILTNPPTDTLGPSSNLQGMYGTGFQTAEINLRRGLCDYLTLLGGFRYAKLDETLTIMEPSGGPGIQSWDTRNKLYGFQLGLDGILYQNDRWRVNGILKGGVYENVGNLSVDVTEPASHFRSFSRSSGNKSAFLGEVGLYTTYQLSHHWAIRGGCQLLWLTNVATAPDQVAATSNIFATPGNIPSSIDMTGDVWYRGINVGLEFTY